MVLTIKNSFFVMILLSVTMYTVDFPDYSNLSRSMQRQASETAQTVKKIIGQEPEKSTFEIWLEDVRKQSQRVIKQVSNVDISFKNYMPQVLKTDDVIDIKIDRIGLQAATCGLSAILAYNSFKKLVGVHTTLVGNKIVFGLSGVIIYSMVANNDIIKQDVRDVLAACKACLKIT